MSEHRESTDRATWWLPAPQRKQGRSRLLSQYVPMRDGVMLAVDVHLPATSSGAPLPTILHQTRYYRGVELRPPAARLSIEWLIDHTALTRARFVAAGYAWVDVCARGSGASTGSRPCPWGPDEIADGGEIVDWIVAQPWSNGRVGSTGVSYAGTTSEFLLANQHPAVVAIAPRFSVFDVYTDIAFPGGIHLEWFTDQWSRYNRALDRGSLDEAFAMKIRTQLEALCELDRRRIARNLLAPGARLLTRASTDRAARWLIRQVATGVRRVGGDDRELYDRALADHVDNVDVHLAALEVQCRDDAGVSPLFPDANIDFFSPHAYSDRTRGAGAAILNMSGWFDGAYQAAAVNRYLTTSDERGRLILGPWEHGGTQNVSPFVRGHKTAFDQEGELLRFFDLHLRGREEIDPGPPVRYFTVGEERWKSAKSWPPPEARYEKLYLGDRRRLIEVGPSASGVDEYEVDPDVGSGRRSRWESLVGLLPPVGYADRRETDRRLLVYRSAPLAGPLEVTGHPLLRLWLSADQDDPYLFAYLEQERPGGRVEYVTEGCLRLAAERVATAAPYRSPAPFRTFTRADVQPWRQGECRLVELPLLPTSWRFAAGHRLRVAFAGADADHFRRPGAIATLGFHRGGERQSSLLLPVIGDPPQLRRE